MTYSQCWSAFVEKCCQTPKHSAATRTTVGTEQGPGGQTLDSEKQEMRPNAPRAVTRSRGKVGGNSVGSGQKAEAER